MDIEDDDFQPSPVVRRTRGAKRKSVKNHDDDFQISSSTSKRKPRKLQRNNVTDTTKNGDEFLSSSSAANQRSVPSNCTVYAKFCESY